MSQILIKKLHNMTEAQLRSLVEDLGEKLKSKFGGEYKLENGSMSYIYRGVNAEISFDRSYVKVDIKLGLLMTALKGKIEYEINSYLDNWVK